MLTKLIQNSPERTALFLFGVFFVAVMLLIAIAIPNPTVTQWLTFNLVLALVAAAIAAMLPGAMHLEFTPWIKAGGSFAVFALVYLVKPAALVADDPSKPLPPPPPIATAKQVIDGWLALMDDGKYEDAYRLTFHGFQDSYQPADFVRLGRELRTPLGKVVDRKEVGQNTAQAQFGHRGHYRGYMFLTRFEGASEPIEEYVLVFAKDAASGWEPAGYNFNVQKAAATRLPVAASDPVRSFGALSPLPSK